MSRGSASTRCSSRPSTASRRIYRDRPNLVARLPGTGGGRSLAFSGHMDVMPTYGKTWEVFPDPYSGRIKDGRMYGRGTLDMKAGTAAGFWALRCLRELGVSLKGTVYAESVVDEENGGVNGTIAARLRNPDIDFAILSEPSGLAVGIESIGGSDWKASVSEAGPGGIGPDAELPNPIYKLARVALALEKYDRRLAGMRVPDTYDPGMRVRLLTYQLASGGSGYAESGAVPTSGHLFFWQETYAYWSEREARADLEEFVRRELAAYPALPGGEVRLETVIRFLEGHRTDRRHPALGSHPQGLRGAGAGAPRAGHPLRHRRLRLPQVLAHRGGHHRPAGLQPARGGRVRGGGQRAGSGPGDGADRAGFLRLRRRA